MANGAVNNWVNTNFGTDGQGGWANLGSQAVGIFTDMWNSSQDRKTQERLASLGLQATTANADAQKSAADAQVSMSATNAMLQNSALQQQQAQQQAEQQAKTRNILIIAVVAVLGFFIVKDRKGKK